MTDAMFTVLLSRLIDLAQIAMLAYAIKRGFDYLTARLDKHGPEPIILQRKDADQ